MPEYSLPDYRTDRLVVPCPAGNGWAAAGIARVLATIKYSPYASKYRTQTANLAAWGAEIVTAAFAQVRPDGLLPNVFGSKLGSTFSDAGASALLASAAYRLAVLGAIPLDGAVVAAAERVRLAVEAGVRENGWLSPVSDPLSFTVAGRESPEAQAFVLLMEAAWVDWKAAL